MKSLLSILVSVALIGALFAGDRHKERTRTKTYSSAGASCAGQAVTASPEGSTNTTARNNVGVAGVAHTEQKSKPLPAAPAGKMIYSSSTCASGQCGMTTRARRR